MPHSGEKGGAVITLTHSASAVFRFFAISQNLFKFLQICYDMNLKSVKRYTVYKFEAPVFLVPEILRKNKCGFDLNSQCMYVILSIKMRHDRPQDL